MDLGFTEDQLLLRHSVERYLADNYDFARRHVSLASPDSVNPRVWVGLAELGILALPFPEAMGGLGLGAVEMGLVMEAAGRHLLVEPLLPTLILAGGVLARCGDSAQRDRWLTPMIAGDARAAMAVEDVATTHPPRAIRVGSEWRLSGAKASVVGAVGANTLIIAALDDDLVTRLFVIPSDHAGLSIASVRLVDGSRAADVRFDHVVVPDGALLGGDAVAVLALVQEEAAVAACWEAAGAMSAALDQTVEYVKQREQFGRPIATFQTVQHIIAEMSVACQEARAAAIFAALAIDANRGTRSRIVSAAKVKSGRAAEVVAMNAVQLHGGMGVSDELPIASYFRKLLAFNLQYGSPERHLGRYRDSVARTGGFAGSAVLVADARP